MMSTLGAVPLQRPSHCFPTSVLWLLLPVRHVSGQLFACYAHTHCSLSMRSEMHEVKFAGSAPSSARRASVSTTKS